MKNRRTISKMIGLQRATVVGVLQLLVLTTPLTAQQLYGSLVGNVTDSTGAALPGATVTATQLETSLTREVVTNASGACSIPNIPSGTYRVVVTVSGFQTFTASNITVTNRDTRVDARLNVGSLQESVTVLARAAILQTETAAVQHQATSEQLQTLPTSGRAFQSFVTLTTRPITRSTASKSLVHVPGRPSAILLPVWPRRLSIC
jgi:hypothetical protein